MSVWNKEETENFESPRSAPGSTSRKKSRSGKSRRQEPITIISDSSNSDSDGSSSQSESWSSAASIVDGNHTRRKPKSLRRASVVSRETCPAHVGMRSLRPPNHLYDRLLGYRIYRLENWSRMRSNCHSDRAWDHVKMLELILKDHIFSGEDPISVLTFLSEFVSGCDTLDRSEGQA